MFYQFPYFFVSKPIVLALHYTVDPAMGCFSVDTDKWLTSKDLVYLASCILHDSHFPHNTSTGDFRYSDGVLRVCCLKKVVK